VHGTVRQAVYWTLAGGQQRCSQGWIIAAKMSGGLGEQAYYEAA
jgi:hypothetical protein